MKIILSAFFLLCLIPSQAYAKPTAKKNEHKHATSKLEEAFIGKKNAPVVLTEYTSITCGHCADFHEKVLPELKKRFVDTGVLKIVSEDFPLDGVALKLAAAIRSCCMEQYLELRAVLFKKQNDWIFAKKPLEAAKNILMLHGLSYGQFDEAIKNKTIKCAIMSTYASVEKDIDGTPAFFINGKEYKGDYTLKAFSAAIEKAHENVKKQA